ncbi:MAG: hypothetical protein QOJ37_3852 [Pseudonocardiales bacterium]|nr:hypothetical protein [Pseudonocardiales bacterium]
MKCLSDLEVHRDPEARAGIANVDRVVAALRAITERHGPSAAKSAKACLSGMFGLAIEDGGVAVNPVRESSARISVGKKSPRALAPEETTVLTQWFRSNDRAVALDLPDLVVWMLATGCRTGEALALRHGPNSDGKPLLDLQAKTWEVNATVVRVPKEGLIVRPRPKTAPGWRVVPNFAVQMVRDRGASSRRRAVPGPPRAHLARPSNASGDLRQLLDSFDCGACAHTG